MPAQKLHQMLDQHHIKYISINHSPAYTARETAASTFVPRAEFAKTITSRHVDIEALRNLAHASEARLATEDEFRELFPDCEVGAMPPFGSLYDIRVFVDDLVTEIDDLCFNAGTHEQIMRMDCGDYMKLEQPATGTIAIKE